MKIFFDNLDVISNSPIIVEAELRMLSEKDGGRIGPFNSGYSPNHNFGDENNSTFYVGRIKTDNDELIYPGNVVIVYVEFLNVLGLESAIMEKGKWIIQEGFKKVGYARLIRFKSAQQGDAPEPASPAR